MSKLCCLACLKKKVSQSVEIVAVNFRGYNKVGRQYVSCFLMIDKDYLTAYNVFEISIKAGFQICSEIGIDPLMQEYLIGREAEIRQTYECAKTNGYALIYFVNPLDSSRPMPATPRFSESDFEEVIVGCGGSKIPESDKKTPDFLIGNVVLELKDIQHEGLYNPEKRRSISRIFKDYTHDFINLNPECDYGQFTSSYHNLIRNSIENHVKKAGKQIKEFQSSNAINVAGMILLNTGQYSLPYITFKEMAEYILLYKTSTIEFILLFSQVNQSNGFDSYSIFHQEFIGKVPDNVLVLKGGIDGLIDKKMTEMVSGTFIGETIKSQEPISFFSDNKIFFWNPGPANHSRTNI